MRAKLTAWAGAVLSAATVAEPRRPISVSLGLWQRTHCSTWLRFSPCRERKEWQPLHLAVSTTLRRGSTTDPSTEKYLIWLMAPYSVASSLVVPGRMV